MLREGSMASSRLPSSLNASSREGSSSRRPSTLLCMQSCHTEPCRIAWESTSFMKKQVRTTAQADRVSYMAMPASASARAAVQMATARSEPPDSMIRQCTSTTALGKLLQMTAAVQALCRSAA